MILYHMSQTLKCGDIFVPDFQETESLCEPFIQALEYSEDCFYGMLLNGKYFCAVLCKFHLREWSDYAKWATEGLFEFVRKNEYPDCYSRLNSFFFYDDLDYSRKLFWYDWGSESDEERSKVHLFEVEVDDAIPQRRDMSLFDKAYNALSEKQDTASAFNCARQYFSGKQSDEPVWEIISNKRAIVRRDISDKLSNSTYKAVGGSLDC